MSDERIYYPLTYQQKGIWYTEKVYPGTSIGNIAASLRFIGEVDYSLLERAINIFIEKNIGVRLRIYETDGDPKQYLSEYSYRKIDLIDFSHNDITELYKWEEEQASVPLNIIDSDLFYFAMIKVNDNDGGFYAKFHHLISDAWTFALLGNQVVEYYSALKNGYEIPYENIPSYIEHIVNEQEYLESERFNSDWEYWNNEFEKSHELSTLKPRITNNITTKAKRKAFVVSKAITESIYNYCSANKTSVFSLFLSALALYITRVTDKQEVVIGTTILNRSNFKEKKCAGMFVSTVPAKIIINEGWNFNTLEQNVSRKWMSILRHQKYPFDLLLQKVREKYKITDNLYDITLSYQNAKFNKEEHSEQYQTRWHFNGYQVESLAIHINDRENEGNLIINYDFLENLFYSKEIEFLHEQLINLLCNAIENHEKNINNIEMLSEKEKNKILYDFNNSKSDYPKEKTIHQLFEEQVQKTPENIALVLDDRSLTYKELNEKANQLARFLRKKGVKFNDTVGLMTERSFEMIIGILGILKAGGAYLPIDPEYPEERIQYILKDSKTKLLLTQEKLKDMVKFDGEEVILENKKNYENDKTDLENINKPEDLIYVIYTSGSTGMPKGVMIEHKGVVNYILWANKVYVKGETSAFPLYSSLSFDLTVTSIFTPLISGNTIIIYSEDLNNALIKKVFEENKVDIVKLTPAHLALVKDMDNSESKIKRLIVGGEDLKTELAQKVFESFGGNVEIYNEYGPTETVVGCMIYKFDKNEKRLSVPIGKPADNVQLYILDKYLNPVPIGIKGELYVGGDGVARGYLNKPELTKERFIANPFNPEKKIYKTGDLARWFAQGDMEYLGRADHQVKIRGFRIELGEIERQLLKHKDVKEVVVLERGDGRDNKYLCAYIVGDKKLISSELRTFLSKHLPTYMVPSHFVFVNSMPLTQNGKVDRKALPELEDILSVEAEYIAPTNEIEDKLAQIWSEILGLKKVGILDNFFDLGGNSLNVIVLITKISKVFSVRLPLSDVYKLPILKNLAEHIKDYDNFISDFVDENLILIRKGLMKNKHIFLIHAGSGEIDNYTNFCNNLNEEFNCWGLRFERFNRYAPINISIEEIARKYLDKMRKVQSNGPYNIFGWCIGGTIAIEISNILEEENDMLANLSIINSIAPQKWNDISVFTADNEKKLIKRWTNDTSLLQEIKKYDDVDEIWKIIIKNANKLDIKKIKESIPSIIINGIKNIDHMDIKDLIYYINIFRTLHNARALYFPDKQVKTQVTCFDVIENEVIIDKETNNKIWGQYFSAPAQIYKVSGGHYSIFDHPYVTGFAQLFNKVLSGEIVKL